MICPWCQNGYLEGEEVEGDDDIPINWKWLKGKLPEWLPGTALGESIFSRIVREVEESDYSEEL